MGAEIQTNIGKMPKGFKGGVSNSNDVSRVNGSAIAIVGVGSFVSYSADGFTTVTNANKGSLAGVVLKSALTDGETIEAGKNVTVAQRGSIFVFCETACTKGAKVFVRHTDDSDLLAGDVRNDVDTDKAFEIDATFAETLSSAGLVEINLK